MKPPFDNLQTVTELVYLRKIKKIKPIELAEHFNCSYDKVIEALRIWSMRKNAAFEKKTEEVVGHKYDFLLEEPINIGKKYREYLKEYGLKVPKGFWGKI